MNDQDEWKCVDGVKQRREGDLVWMTGQNERGVSDDKHNLFACDPKISCRVPLFLELIPIYLQKIKQ